MVSYGNSFSVGTPQAGSIDKLAMMRLGAVTHSVNMEQRYVPLEFTANGGSLVAETPANPNIAPPGVYMLFAIDSNGVPSVAKMVRIEGSAPGPLAPTITDTDPNSPSKDNAPEVSGTGAAAGSTVRVYGEAGCTGPVLGSGTATVFNGTQRDHRDGPIGSDDQPQGEGDRHRRQHIALLGRVPLHRGLDGARHDHHREAACDGDESHGDVRVHLDRARFDLRMQV